MFKQIIDCGYYGPIQIILSYQHINDLYRLYLTSIDLAKITRQYIISNSNIDLLYDCMFYECVSFIIILFKHTNINNNTFNLINIWKFDVIYKDLEVFKLLINKGIDPSNNTIGLASKKGQLEIVKLLLKDKRVDPSADNNYAIRWASHNGHHEVVKLLFDDKRVSNTIN